MVFWQPGVAWSITLRIKKHMETPYRLFRCGLGIITDLQWVLALLPELLQLYIIDLLIGGSHRVTVGYTVYRLNGLVLPLNN